jgi:hypothetical protein
MVYLVDLGLDARHHVIGVEGSAHDHDGQRNIVLVIAARDTQPRHVADGDLGDVLDLHRDAVELGKDNILDVVDLPTVGQIGLATIIEKPDTADVHGLLTDGDLASPNVDI